MGIIDAFVETPLGAIGILVKDGVLCGLDLEPDRTIRASDALPAMVREQLMAYFEDGSHAFELPLDLQGTTFQIRVWEALREIPPGCTVTYGALAWKLGTGARAIGGACRANPCPIVVPCHRIVAGKGLGGFAGDSSGRKLAVKRWLLRHEGALSPGTPPVSKRLMP
ncbi:methylated-DNA--[protein]-cysteine S-methyltransferase [Candidatus Thiosymbion oneisti]|uniref:methylated-DNA--[protein]-cysteine S-methyltransferase n=1 Tax=Candidatus Thiosymbion oneisti TaxID=589554 RepID=UPI000AE5586F|nr:methylated-DNA--[protein]-cysteine S-methyltransferase [Candidatus Thiosymbion oneisti]